MRGDASTAGVGQQEGNPGQRRQQGAEIQTECANLRPNAVEFMSESEKAMCRGTGPTVVVEMIVSTSVKDIDDTWAALNEKAINNGLNAKGLPPAVIKYGSEKNAGSVDVDDVSGAGLKTWQWILILCVCYTLFAAAELRFMGTQTLLDLIPG